MYQARIKKSYLGLIVIFGTAAVLFLILMFTVAILVMTRLANDDSQAPNPIVGTTNPLNRIETEKIDPALALASLGGRPEIDVIAEAVGKARAETALAALLFNPALSNRETAGGLLQLAAAYNNENDFDKALFSYRLAGTVATLAPDLSDTIRADIFMETGEGLINIGQQNWAKLYLDQAFTVATSSPYLQGAHRRRIFERLQKNYLILDERAVARESLSLSANPPNLTLLSENSAILPASRPVPLPEAAQTAESVRWRAAQELAILLVERGGRAPQAVINRLADALVAEDQQKISYFDQEIATTTQLSRKIDFILAKINWLSMKYRIARQGYGLSIVPAWESQTEQIRADLTKTYETLFALYADVVIALPDVSQIDKATGERLRMEILAGELGRYPNYPEEQRRAQLLDASQIVRNTQPETGISIGEETVADETVFVLVPLEAK